MTHDQLVLRAERFLKNMGCGVVFSDRFRAATHNGEQPDAIGWRDSVRYSSSARQAALTFWPTRKSVSASKQKTAWANGAFLCAHPG